MKLEDHLTKYKHMQPFCFCFFSQEQGQPISLPHSQTRAQDSFVWGFVFAVSPFPWRRFWKWLPMRSTSLAWEQKQWREHIITSQGETESCLPVCLRCRIWTFSTAAAATAAVPRVWCFCRRKRWRVDAGCVGWKTAHKDADKDGGLTTPHTKLN